VKEGEKETRGKRQIWAKVSNRKPGKWVESTLIQEKTFAHIGTTVITWEGPSVEKGEKASPRGRAKKETGACETGVWTWHILDTRQPEGAFKKILTSKRKKRGGEKRK